MASAALRRDVRSERVRGDLLRLVGELLRNNQSMRNTIAQARGFMGHGMPANAHLRLRTLDDELDEEITLLRATLSYIDSNLPPE
jgi:hypothetical protein